MSVKLSDDIMGTLVALSQSKQATRSDLGLSAYHIKRLVDNSIITSATVKGQPVTRKVTDADGSPQRGRPSHVFKLTDAGRGRVKRFLNAQAKQDAATA